MKATTLMKTLLVGVALTTDSMAVAQTGKPAILVVHRTDGGTDFYALAEQPRTTLGGNAVTIASATVSTTYQRSEVKSYTYEVQADGIADQKANSLMVKQTSSGISLSGLKAGSTVRLITSDGRLLKAFRAGQTGSVDIATDGLPTGIYLIQTQRQTLKIVRP